VFSVGLEENLFPSAMSMYDRNDLEEERRLFYVAVTRAKERLWITYANSRYRFGSLVQNDPSRFIKEVPPSFIDNTFTGIGNKGPVGGNTKGGSLFGNSADNYDKVPSLKKLADKLASTKPAANHTPTAGFEANDAAEIQEGMQVEHQKFGFGKVLTLEGGANNRIAGIDFGSHGVKKIMLNYAKLRIVK
jgi:DNA helicase-2/ATP-dependent DNA helicase PcrA